MIPGDYIYTNYICRIGIVFQHGVYIDEEPDMDYVVLHLRNRNIFFRRNGKNFLLENRYGEKKISKHIKALMKILITKALRDSGEDFEDIEINGERITVEFDDFKVIAQLKNDINFASQHYLAVDGSIVPPGNDRCPLRCPLKDYCTDTIEPHDIGHLDWSSVTSRKIAQIALFNMALGMNILNAGIALVENLIDDENDKTLEPAKLKIIENIGYEKADTLFWIAKKVLNGRIIKNRDIDLEDYKGYIARYKDMIYPTDKFWNLVYGEGKEEKIRGLYEIWGD